MGDLLVLFWCGDWLAFAAGRPAITALAAAVPGKRIVVSATPIGKVTQPKALHYKPTAADKDHAGRSGEEGVQHDVTPPPPQSP